MSFKCDFKMAQINAVNLVYPDANISGCYRHYNAAIWKNAEKKGLLKTKEGRNIARITAIIPLVPANQSPATWCYILSQAPHSPEMNRFHCYYEKQWYPKL